MFLNEVDGRFVAFESNGLIGSNRNTDAKESNQQGPDKSSHHDASSSLAEGCGGLLRDRLHSKQMHELTLAWTTVRTWEGLFSNGCANKTETSNIEINYIYFSWLTTISNKGNNCKKKNN
jgi:hypothetical protein